MTDLIPRNLRSSYPNNFLNTRPRGRGNLHSSAARSWDRLTRIGLQGAGNYFLRVSPSKREATTNELAMRIEVRDDPSDRLILIRKYTKANELVSLQ